MKMYSYYIILYRFRYFRPLVKLVPNHILDMIKSKIIFKIEQTNLSSEEHLLKNVDVEKNRVWKNIDIALGFIEAEKNPQAKLMNRNVNKIIFENISKSNKILELGCGYGGLTLDLLNTESQIVAIDTSEILLKHLKRQLKKQKPIYTNKVNILKGDAFKLPFKDETFDSVVSRMFIYHFLEWKSLIVESKRVVKKEGTVIHHMPIEDNYSFWKRSELVGIDQSRYQNDILSYNSIVEFKHLEIFAKENQLSITKIIPTQFFHFNSAMRTNRDGLRMAPSDKLLKNRNVQEFMEWYDNNITVNMPPGSSLWNLVFFKKIG